MNGVAVVLGQTLIERRCGHGVMMAPAWGRRQIQQGGKATITAIKKALLLRIRSHFTVPVALWSVCLRLRQFLTLQEGQMTSSGSSSMHVLKAGQQRVFASCSGDRIICLEGQVQVRSTPPDWSWRWQACLRAGESHDCDGRGLLQLQAETACTVIHLPATSSWHGWAGRGVQAFLKWCMIRFIRRGVEQSGSSSGS